VTRWVCLSPHSESLKLTARHPTYFVAIALEVFPEDSLRAPRTAAPREVSAAYRNRTSGPGITSG
jgi:hypothetical protein